MRLDETVQGTPLRVQRSMRGDNVRALTSAKAGRVIPLAYHVMLREDAIRLGDVGVSVRMAETVHPLINAVNVRLYAHLVPFSAFERFDGMDDFNRSYSGVAVGGVVKPFFQSVAFDKDHIFWKTLGIHAAAGQVNSAPVEAYNLLVNWRRAARTKHLPERVLTNTTTLARAFWAHPINYEIVPDYELALMDGEVPLGINLDALPPTQKLPVEGIYINNKATDESTATENQVATVFTGKIPSNGKDAQTVRVRGGAFSGSGSQREAGRADIYVTLPDIFDEMRQNGISISLSNIEMAKQTVAFAKLRQQYQGISEDHLIAMLMDAIRVPPESLRQPILLGRASGVVGMTERHATDGESLGVSRTTGAVSLRMRLRCPPVNTGGIVLITAEITPEPLFERMGDPLLWTMDPQSLPQFLRDYLDPRKVDMVENREVDVLHSAPEGLFGYRGLNRKWDRDFTLAGGKFYRPVGDAFKEDRQRFWVVESNDPALTEDFYLVSSDLKYTPFADQNADPFEILTVSHLEVEGNTVFGKALHEDTGDYAAIIDRVQGNEEVSP